MKNINIVILLEYLLPTEGLLYIVWYITRCDYPHSTCDTSHISDVSASGNVIQAVMVKLASTKLMTKMTYSLVVCLKRVGVK